METEAKHGSLVEYASLKLRLSAFFTDLVLVSMLSLALRLVFPDDSLVAAIIWFVAVVVYFVGTWTRLSGASPGKKAFGLRVVCASGKPVGVQRAALRFLLGYPLTTATLFAGFAMAAFDGEKRALHDRLAGTRVVRVLE